MRVIENVKIFACFNIIIFYKLRDKIILLINHDFIFIF